MASGVNTTFRQIGIAAGIAALGSIFTSAMLHSLSHASPLASSASRVGTMVRQGQVSHRSVRPKNKDISRGGPE